MNQEEKEALEDTYRIRINALDDSTKKKFYQAYETNLKDPDTFATLCYFFVVGLHYAYLKRYPSALIVMVLMATGIYTLTCNHESIMGWFIVISILLLEISNLFQSQSIVAKYNLELMRSLLEKYEASQ